MEDGHQFNVVHRVARELIGLGLAHEGFGHLELTEAGRMVARRNRVRRDYAARALRVDDPNVADLARLEDDGRVVEERHVGPFVDAPAPIIRENIPAPIEAAPPRPVTVTGELAWSRDRATRAAGQANGKTDIWVDPTWIQAFMEAYESA
jgi:hypothetical protein